MAFFLAVCLTTLARVASLRCSPGLVSLVVEDSVEDSAGASALASATNCTGLPNYCQEGYEGPCEFHKHFHPTFVLIFLFCFVLPKTSLLTPYWRPTHLSCLVTDCSVCSKGYTRTLFFTCTKCLDSRGGVAIMIVVAVVFLCAIIVLLMHLVSGETLHARRGIVHRITERLPLQSIKIIVVVWQILTQVRDTVRVG